MWQPSDHADLSTRRRKTSVERPSFPLSSIEHSSRIFSTIQELIPRKRGPQPKKSSHRDLTPLEEGGRTARDGFAYQDHITVSKCLDMLLGGPSEVWCEAEDDIVLVWSVGTSEEFEFVQVKGHDIKQAWTVARLCSRETAKDGKKKSSIVEKSLAHDRGAEPCRFRIITTWAPDAVLEVLGIRAAARSAPELRARLTAARMGTHIERETRSEGRQSLTGIRFLWIEQAEWEQRASSDVKSKISSWIGCLILPESPSRRTSVMSSTLPCTRRCRMRRWPTVSPIRRTSAFCGRSCVPGSWRGLGRSRTRHTPAGPSA
ncbi:MAG: DUF4297 domain-containing protein [Labilithrix sp.]|nr:DUF4297 domain-containing protein [Labilithrix sp.]